MLCWIPRRLRNCVYGLHMRSSPDQEIVEWCLLNGSPDFGEFTKIVKVVGEGELVTALTFERC